MNQTTMNYRIVVMGASAGGVEVFENLLGHISEDFALTIVIVQHIAPDSEGSLVQLLNSLCSLTVKEAEHNEKIKSATVYIAPANYHLYIEADETFSLSIDDKVNYSRPSIDLLFESAARIYGDRLIGVIFTGANRDGADGLKKIQGNGGCTIVQDPNTAKTPVMPSAALEAVKADYILDIKGINDFLMRLAMRYFLIPKIGLTVDRAMGEHIGPPLKKHR